MKKFLKRVIGTVAVMVGLCHNFCYADVVSDIDSPLELGKALTTNPITLIFIGLAVALIVITAIIILIISKKK